jgi:hypothetical protein
MGECDAEVFKMAAQVGGHRVFNHFLRKRRRHFSEREHPPQPMDFPDCFLFAGAGGDYSDHFLFVVIFSC